MMVKRLRSVSILTVLALALMPVQGYCLPQGEQVVEGSAAFDRSQANTLNINQATDKMIANYNSFSIAQPEAVHFIQPSSSSIALNRVVGVDPSLILGTLTANGRVFLINPNGVTFGQGCRVDTAGLLASTLDISNGDFMAGRYSFAGVGGSVVNMGYLSAPGGYVALLGSRVENKGIIEAELGSVALASGKAVTLKLDPNGFMSVVIDEATISNFDNKDDAVKNSGTIKADGGKVLLTAQALDGVFKKAVNTDGIIEANSVGDVMGEVAVDANQRVAIGGTINAQGGIVRVNCQGADFTGAINARLGLYNMNNGDTFVTGGTYTGNQTWNDNLNVFVSGVTTVTDGSIYINADNDHNGSGDLSIKNASLFANSGDILLTGVNISIEDSLIAATRSFGSVNVYAKLTNDLTIKSTGSGPGSVSSISSTLNGNGNALAVFDAAGDISVTGQSAITAEVIGNGQSNCDLHSSNGSIIAGDESGLITTIRSLVDGNGLADSMYIDAWLGIRTGINDYTEGGAGVSITNARLSATVGGSGSSEIDLISGGTGQVDIGGSLSSIVTARSGSESAEVDLETYAGDINISDESNVQALIDGDGKAKVVFLAHSDDVNISGGSAVEAIVEANGEALVNFYDWRIDDLTEYPILGSIDMGGPLEGDINITGGSTVLAQAGNEDFSDTAAIYMYTDGSINVLDSSVNAQDVYGNAGIAMLAGGDIEVNGAGSVGATSAYSFAGVVGVADDSINVDGLVFAEAGDGGAAGVALLARNDISANVYAFGSNNFMPFALDFINGFLGGDNPTQYLSVDTDKFYASSFALLGSLSGDITLGDVTADAVLAAALGIDNASGGNIYDAGLVSSNMLGLVARGNIGTAEAPIDLDVNMVGAYSYDTGDIYLNQIASEREIELGIYLPVDLYTLTEGGEGGDSWTLSARPFIEIGASVAANDGIVHVTSDGNMIVNSILAPRGGVFLESTNGNIYAGRGWVPLVSQASIDSVADVSLDLVNDLLNKDYSVGYISDIIGQAMMAGSEISNGMYMSPVMGGFILGAKLEPSANVWAAGYSYFSTPNGTIGVDPADNTDPDNPDPLQGAIKGIVRPGVSDLVSARPGFDLVPENGYVLYQDKDSKRYGPLSGYEPVVIGAPPIQIWPDLPSFEFADPLNPLEVNIQLVEGAKSAAPVRVGGDNPFSPVSGLTLNFKATVPPVVPPVPPTGPSASSQLPTTLTKDLRAYYEILSVYRFSSVEPATPTTFFSYRPLTPMDMGAFDSMSLDEGMYDFISDNIKPKKPLSPYLQ